MSDKKLANLKVDDGRRMRDKEVLEDGGARVRPKDSVKEGKIGMIRGMRVTLAKMVASRDSPISHQQRSGGTEDRRQSQTTEGTGRLGDGDEGDSERED